MTWDLQNDVTSDTRLTTPQNDEQETRSSQESEGASHESPPVSAGTSLSGRMHTIEDSQLCFVRCEAVEEEDTMCLLEWGTLDRLEAHQDSTLVV